MRLNRKGFTAIILLMLLVLGNVSFAQMGWIKGKVIEKDTDKHIPGAEVFYTITPGMRRGVICDDKGNFRTAKFEKGMILGIEIKAEGYYTNKWEVILGDGGRAMSFEMTNIQKSKAGQERRRKESTPVPITFKIVHRDAMKIFELVQAISCARSASRELQTITAMGTPEQIMSLDNLIDKYDTPLKQIWLEVLLIKAKGNGGGKPKYPPEIDSIVRKLQSLFKFGNYLIIGRGNAMGLEGATLSFSANAENDTQELVQQHPFNVQTRLGAAGDVIKLQNLKVVISYPQYEIMTSINVKNGETVILGANRGKSGEEALITVVTAKIMH